MANNKRTYQTHEPLFMHKASYLHKYEDANELHWTTARLISLLLKTARIVLPGFSTELSWQNPPNGHQ